jgi:AcrR family transcriptional regulator
MTGSESEAHEESAIPERLIQAALKCFLNDDYHNVTRRKIADVADVSAAMIRYYFGSKEGLYEEMIRQTLLPLINALDQPADETALNFSSFARSNIAKEPLFIYRRFSPLK